MRTEREADVCERCGRRESLWHGVCVYVVMMTALGIYLGFRDQAFGQTHTLWAAVLFPPNAPQKYTLYYAMHDAVRSYVLVKPSLRKINPILGCQTSYTQHRPVCIDRPPMLSYPYTKSPFTLNIVLLLLLLPPSSRAICLYPSFLPSHRHTHTRGKGLEGREACPEKKVFSRPGFSQAHFVVDTLDF